MIHSLSHYPSCAQTYLTARGHLSFKIPRFAFVTLTLSFKHPPLHFAHPLLTHNLFLTFLHLRKWTLMFSGRLLNTCRKKVTVVLSRCSVWNQQTKMAKEDPYTQESTKPEVQDMVGLSVSLKDNNSVYELSTDCPTDLMRRWIEESLDIYKVTLLFGLFSSISYIAGRSTTTSLAYFCALLSQFGIGKLPKR